MYYIHLTSRGLPNYKQLQPRYFPSFSADYKTSNYLETNIAALDNSATPNLKHSQMRPLEREVAEEWGLGRRGDNVQFDWLGCIARKTGMPRMLLTSVIFLSAMVMIWLCFTTAATAPDQRVTTQVSWESLMLKHIFLRPLVQWPMKSRARRLRCRLAV